MFTFANLYLKACVRIKQGAAAIKNRKLMAEGKGKKNPDSIDFPAR